ncbi:hypothetical protein KKI23_03145 [Patescibacteria group bacterium]|nr:hypothetical protein [Patescibacteria group bacterium]
MKRLIVTMLAVLTLAIVTVQPALSVHQYVKGADERTTEDGVLEQYLAVDVEYPRIEVIKAYSIRPGPGKEHDRLHFAEVGATFRVWDVQGDWLKIGPRKQENNWWIERGGIKEIKGGSHLEMEWVPVTNPEPPPSRNPLQNIKIDHLIIAGIVLLVTVIWIGVSIRARRREKRKGRR